MVIHYLSKIRVVLQKTALSTKKLLVARIHDTTKSKLMGVQNGFRAGRSTVEQEMALRCMLDICHLSRRLVTITFVDFNKAFNTIDVVLLQWY